MKVAVRKRESGVRFNITPLIDICFNLIVFFGLASLYVKKEIAESVALPMARKFDANDRAAPRRLVITIDSSRRIFAGGDEIGVSDVERLISLRCANQPQNFEVRVRADRSVPFADVKPVVLACAQHGITSLKFAVDAKPQ